MPSNETGATGLEPATSGVTGRRSNQLSYAPWETGEGIARRGLSQGRWICSLKPAPARRDERIATLSWDWPQTV